MTTKRQPPKPAPDEFEPERGRQMVLRMNTKQLAVLNMLVATGFWGKNKHVAAQRLLDEQLAKHSESLSNHESDQEKT